MRIYLFRIAIAVGAVGLLAPSAAFALYDIPGTGATADQREKIEHERQELKQKVEEAREAMKEKGKEIREELKDRKTVIKQEFGARTATARTEMKDKMLKLRDEFKAKMETRKEELKKKFGEQRAARIEQFFTNMTEKFEHAIDRLDGLADRIESRINALSAAGKDMTGPKADLAVAQAKIDAAEKGLADTKTKYAELGTSTDPRKKFAEVKTLVAGVEQQVKEAHAALIRTIAGMKGMGSTTATTTPAQ